MLFFPSFLFVHDQQHDGISLFTSTQQLQWSIKTQCPDKSFCFRLQINFDETFQWIENIQLNRSTDFQRKHLSSKWSMLFKLDWFHVNQNCSRSRAYDRFLTRSNFLAKWNYHLCDDGIIDEKKTRLFLTLELRDKLEDRPAFQNDIVLIKTRKKHYQTLREKEKLLFLEQTSTDT